MATKTQICNMALAHLGIGVVVVDVDASSTPNSLACKLFYETARDQVFRDYLWPFATKTADLVLVVTDPTTEWKYGYTYPDDCMRVARILSDFWPETPEQKVPYRVMVGEASTIILTNKENAQAEYVMLRSEEASWSADFTLAFSLLIASMIAPRVTGGDQFKLGIRALQLYQAEIDNARLNAALEEHQPLDAESSYINARG